MIKANHQKIFQWIFDKYLTIIFRKNFHKIEIILDDLKIEHTDKPILIIGNHISWWDGFFVLKMNKIVLHKKFHVMMLEKELVRHKFLTKLGAFSIDKKSRSMVDSIAYARDVLTANQNLLLLYPQGKIGSQYNSEPKFENGWLKIIDRQQENIQVLFYAALLDYQSERKPSVNIYLSEYVPTNYVDVACWQHGFGDFMKQCIENQKQCL